MTVDMVRQAADALAELVSMYCEGRADMDELKEGAIAYYQAKESGLRPPVVRIPPDSGPRPGTHANPLPDHFRTFYRYEGCLVDQTGDRIETLELDNGLVVDTSAWTCEDYEDVAKVHRSNSNPQGMDYGQSYYEGLSGAVPAFEVFNLGKPTEPIPVTVTPANLPGPFRIAPQFWDRIKDGDSIRAQNGAQTIYGTARWSRDQGAFYVEPKFSVQEG